MCIRDRIRRVDRERSINIQANLTDRPLVEVMQEVKALLNKKDLGNQVHYRFTGQADSINEAFIEILQALGLALILVYMILAFLYESLLTPFIRMFSLPLGMIGSLLFLLMMNQTINIYSLIGILVMDGLVAKKDVYKRQMFIFVLLLLPFILSKKRLKQMKSRWLITAALFGATAFAVVSLPTTFISDFFHIILGPFSFLITGMFSGILMYMLLCSLVILIPHMGIVSLMLFVKMLINMIVFGHISPISLLLVGVQAVLLAVSYTHLTPKTLG